MANPSPSNSAASKKQVDVQSNKQISQDINPMSVSLEKNERLQDALESGDAAGVIALFSPMNKWIIELRLWNLTQKVSQWGLPGCHTAGGVGKGDISLWLSPPPPHHYLCISMTKIALSLSLSSTSLRDLLWDKKFLMSSTSEEHIGQSLRAHGMFADSHTEKNTTPQTQFWIWPPFQIQCTPKTHQNSPQIPTYM